MTQLPSSRLHERPAPSPSRRSRSDSTIPYTTSAREHVLAAQHFSTDHHELVMGPRDFREALPRLSWYRDEPIAEVSEIPLLLLAEFAGHHVRVALSGDGGDEVFGGYPKYRADALLRSAARRRRSALRGAFRLMKMRRTHRQLDRATDTLSMRDPLVRWVSWFRTTSSGMIEGLLKPALVVDALPERLAARLSTMLAAYEDVDAGRRMLLGDLLTYLPDNMLLRSDKVLMAGSLEGRMPLLDVALVERATSAPAGSRASLLQSKRILREATATIVPSVLRGGPKRGFNVPVDRFLVGEDGDLLRRLLLSDRTLSRGIFCPDGLRKAVLGSPQERLGSNVLFVLASFELWTRANVDRVTVRPPGIDELFEEEVCPPG